MRYDMASEEGDTPFLTLWSDGPDETPVWAEGFFGPAVLRREILEQNLTVRQIVAKYDGQYTYTSVTDDDWPERDAEDAQV